MDWEGLPEVLGILDTLGEPKVRQRIEKKAVTKAVQPMAKTAKALCPVSTPQTKHSPPLKAGLLKKSIGWAVKQRKGGGMWVGLVGPRKGFKVQIGQRAKTGKAVYQNPIPYAHLVELGAPNAGVGATPFLRPAFDQHKGQAEKTMADVVMAELAKEAAKPAKRGRRR